MRLLVVSAPPRSAGLLAAAATALVLSFLLWISPRSSLWDRDEAIYARVAMETRSSGSFLVPPLDGRPFTHKPPLLAWLQVASLALPVPLETALRLPSALAFAAAGWLTLVAARRLDPGRGSEVALLVLFTSPLALLAGAAATTDALLLAASAASLAALALAARGDAGVRPGLELAAAVALGCLAKGPPGIAFPLLSAAALVVAAPSRERRRTGLLLGGGIAAGLCGFLAWAVPANAASGGLLLADGVGTHVVGRSLQPMEGHGGWGAAGILFYPVVLVLGLVPWTLFLPRGVLEARRSWSPGAAALVGASAAAPFLVFAVVATKLPTYVLPAFPALAVAAAAGIRAAGPRTSAPTLLLYLAGAAPWVALLALAAFGPFPAPVRLLAASASGIAAASGAAGVALLARGRPLASAGALAGGVAALAVAAGLALPFLEPLRPVRAIAAAARAHGGPVATWGFDEPSLHVYAGDPLERIAGPSEASTWARREGSGVLVTTAAAAASIASIGSLQDLADARIETLARASGWNVATGRRVDLVVLARRAR